MYYPYFRGKQFDLLALRQLSEADKLSQAIHPIIEPVKDNPALYKLLQQFDKVKQPYSLIENPQSGDFLTVAGQEKLQQITTSSAHILTTPLNSSSHYQVLIAQNAEVLKDYGSLIFSIPTIVPMEFRLLQRIKGPLILSEDNFLRVRPSYYLEQPDEIFSTAHLNFTKRGFKGFSDFSIDSRLYYEQSYPAREIVLHLVYFAENNQLRIHHFVSPSEELPDFSSRFLAVMAEVIAFPFFPKEETVGLKILKESYFKNKFPGMGILRKASVMHHLELMSRFFDKQI
ncbi:sce7725 family protein [Enterococcus dispar]|jgi:hypothetical protein|uniref:Sce7725 family protein n=1 Tax=Enterococcus dispar ATCC 51266 TaxID=1139219 RepID=S0KF74_9ENTE|nr:sce7725 family protein [Enterococcus dispar]EOT43494.1 hypothetical protein OMK_00849 [Enterococcus dispar ATCC 51266]EOW85058.1 hypothetical protein I569_00351 [Enterococcus dispar ATCC 51266]MCU7358267.1 sce7725 family protein [Enterococcus dispar]MDT2706427.1 sce7725 family protein [Enterococcus dispar]OJG39949.1 hypothetical protein RV01_GL000023 [Enterococcus dispar]